MMEAYYAVPEEWSSWCQARHLDVIRRNRTKDGEGMRNDLRFGILESN